VKRDAKCIFCKIVAEEIPAAVVLADESLVAFLDIGPLAEGHLLIVPREHCERLTDMSAEMLASVVGKLPKLGRSLLAVSGADGFNLLVNQGKVAGQEVPHVHLHLIPRKAGDGLGYRWHPGSYRDDRARQLTEAYRTALAKDA